MNIFKSDLGKEKKLLKAMKELEGLLNEENIEVSAISCLFARLVFSFFFFTHLLFNFMNIVIFTLLKLFLLIY